MVKKSCTQPTIGVIMPSRGLIFAEAIQSVLRELTEYKFKYQFSMPSSLSLPDCFNIPISFMFANKNIDYLWIVEEDVVVPYDCLVKLIDLNSDVAVVDYPLQNGHSTVTTCQGEVLWAGTGCMLIKRKVFDIIKYPYFHTDVTYLIKGTGIYERHVGMQTSYGGHDIHFGIECYLHNIQIKQLKTVTAKHLKLRKLGATANNRGNHEIEKLEVIKRKFDLPKFKVVGIDK